MKKYKYLFSVLVTLYFLMPAGSSAGFIVAPSSIRVKDSAVGRHVELSGIEKRSGFLSIANSGDRDNVYKIEVISCKQYGISPLPGYTDLPDMKWLRIASPDIAVPAGQIGYVKGVFVKIPKKKEYYGKKYQAIVKVTKEANAGQPVNLEVVLPLFIETEKK